MASLPAPYIPNVAAMTGMYDQGYATGQNAFNRKTMATAGQHLAKGDYGGAKNAFFQAGDVGSGLKIQAQIDARAAKQRAEIDRMNAQQREATARINKILGNVALKAETPEAWSAAIEGLKARGVDVSGYEDFGSRDIALATAGMTADYLTRMDAQAKAAAGQRPEFTESPRGILNKGTGEFTPHAATSQHGNMPESLQKALASQDAKTLTDYNEKAQGASEIKRDTDALEAARDQTNFEGSWLDNMVGRGIGRNLGGGLGIIPTSDDVAALDTVNATAGNLILSATSKLKGVLSETDMALVKSTVPDSDMTDKAADGVIAVLRTGAERAQDRAAMFDAWLQAHGSGRGFQEAWARYADDNPVFTQNAQGRVVPNPNPPADWRNYLAPSSIAPSPAGDRMQDRRPFAGRPGPSQPSDPPAAVSTEKPVNEMSDDELFNVLGGR